MAEIFSATKYTASGPLLIDAAQLLELDDAIDQYRSKSMAAGVSGERHSIGGTDEEPRTITFLLRHDKELRARSFREAIAQPTAAHEIAVGLKYEVKLRGTTALLTIDKQTDQATLPLGSFSADHMQLNITVEPRASSLSQEIFGTMKNWACDLQRSYWQKAIFKLKVPAAVIATIWGLIFVVGLFSPSPPNFKEQYKQEARKLLAQGINSNNQQKAIELLLAIEADYSPPIASSSLKPDRSPKWIVENSIALFWLVAIAMFPEFCLGIWKGAQRLRWWRRWLPFVFVTVPGLVATRYLEPRLFAGLERMLGLS